MIVGSEERGGKAMLTVWPDFVADGVVAFVVFWTSGLGAVIRAGGVAGETQAVAIKPNPNVKRTCLTAVRTIPVKPLRSMCIFDSE